MVKASPLKSKARIKFQHKLFLPHFIETSFVLDDVSQSFFSLYRRKFFQGDHSFSLSGHVTLVTQLELPLKIRLQDFDRPDELHVRVDSNPQNRRVAEMDQFFGVIKVNSD